VLVAVDPGKAGHRVWVANQTDGLLEEPRSLPAARSGVDELEALITKHARAHEDRAAPA
jgi:hypothetical protein